MIFLTDNFNFSDNFPRQGEEPENCNSPSPLNGQGDAPFKPPYGFQPPYGNQPPYGGYPYGAPYGRKPSLMKRITEFFADKRVLSLSMASIAAAGAIILFEIFGDIFSLVLRSNESLRVLYTQNHTAEMAMGMLYTLLGVGVPFFIAYLFLRKTGSVQLPLAAPAKKSGALYLIPAGLGICYIGNVAVSYMMSFFSSMGISSYSYDMALTQAEPLPENAFQLICAVMYMAVFPAFFEEFAFRGVVMQPLRKYGDWFAIIVSAVIFGLVHGNIMQMPFAIVAGVALGYSSVVTGSLWTGMIIHFLNNFLSLVYSWARTGLSDSANLVFSGIFTYGIIIIGIVALTGYSWNNPRMLKLYPSVSKVRSSRATAVYFFMPAMLVALVLLAKNILTDIVVR